MEFGKLRPRNGTVSYNDKQRPINKATKAPVSVRVHPPASTLTTANTSTTRHSIQKRNSGGSTNEQITPVVKAVNLVPKSSKGSTNIENVTLLAKISSIESRIKSIEDNGIHSKFDDIESVINLLKSENSEQRSTIAQLKADLECVQQICLQFGDTKSESERNIEDLTTECLALKSEVLTLRTELSEIRQKLNTQPLISESATSSEQQELNSNIVIRGVDTSTCEPISVFDSIRGHLGIADDEAFNPVSVELLPPPLTQPKSVRTIQVRLRSTDVKRQFLQIRRRKKEISLADIGICQGSKKSILITEQLSRGNQQLLYAARSLRDTHKFKFVWSSDGQILVRPQQGDKVTRISDISQINELRAQLNLPPFEFLKNGRNRARLDFEPTESCT